ncbi:laccase domain-containing protein [Brachybacterium sp. GPGPB12]|uniref:laccase domain-containing protein n=1 Tax=Brachybacterium sp. GPGPB12 TaxID=3023517 RepID=UPI00313437EC
MPATRCRSRCAGTPRPSCPRPPRRRAGGPRRWICGRGRSASPQDAGVPAEAIDAEHPCTLEDERFFSYRRGAVTGRFAGGARRG